MFLSWLFTIDHFNDLKLGRHPKLSLDDVYLSFSRIKWVINLFSRSSILYTIQELSK